MHQGVSLIAQEIETLIESRVKMRLKELGDAHQSLIGKPLNEIIKFYIEESLSLCSGNRAEAAKLLGIGERTLYRFLSRQEGKYTVTEYNLLPRGRHGSS